MADHISASLPRLADALLEVGSRLGEIGAELHALQAEGGSPGSAGTLGAAFQGGPAASGATSGGSGSAMPGAPDSPPPALGPTWPPASATEPAAGHAPGEQPKSVSGATALSGSGSTASGATPTGVFGSASSDWQSAGGAFGPASSGGPSSPGGSAASGIPGVSAASGGTATPGGLGPSGGPGSSSGPAAPGGLGSQPGGPHAQAAASSAPRGQQTPWYPPPQPPPPPGPTLWERLSRDGAGSRILAWAGGVVTLAGVVLLLILAIQRGYLGPLPRVLLGAGLGLTLAGIGTRLHRTPAARTGAYALAATGVAVLYLDVVAATSLYQYLPAWGGLVAGLGVTAGGVALAGRWGSELFAVFVVVCCAVSAPVITGGFDTLLLCFLLVLLLGTTPVQLAKRWGQLLLAAGLPPVVAAVVNVGLAGQIGEDATITAVLAGVTSGVVILLATATALRRPDDEFALIVLFLAPVPGMLAALLLPRLGATILPLAVGALLIGVWALGRRAALRPVFALSAGGIGSLALVQATATAFDGDARAIAFLAEALLVAVLAVRLRLAAALAPAAVFGAIGFVIALAFPARPALVTRPPGWTVETSTAVALGLTGVVLAAAALVLCWAGFRLEVLSAEEHTPHGWVPAGLVALYGSTAALVAVGLLVSPDRDGFLLGHVLVTVSWTVGALLLLVRGIDSVPMRVAGLSLVIAALAKLVLFDLSSLDGMARVAAFLVAGLVLLAAGARYAKLVAARSR